MIVVDTNLLAYFWISGAKSKLAEQVFVKDSSWIAPILWRSEFRNVLLGYIRHKILLPEDAVELTEKAEKQMHGKEFQVSSTEVIYLAKDSKCSAYDCEFIALAKRYNVQLVTSDKKVCSEFPDIAVNMAEYIG